MQNRRNILITGTSRGLGWELAQHFLKKGDIVIGCSSSKCEIIHPNYRHYQVDVALADDVADFFYTIRKEIKQLDALINNAGVAAMNAFALTPIESFQKIFNINVQGTFLCCQKALSLLRKGENPRIINFTTVAVPLKLEGESIYAASKSAVETMTRILAKEYGRFGITCNAIGPSPIDTALIKGVPREKIASLVRRQAIERMATPADVIHVAEFFLSPASGMITGQVIYLGGIS